MHIPDGFPDAKAWATMDVVAAGIDIQKALPFGTVYDAREMVKRWCHSLPSLPLLDN